MVGCPRAIYDELKQVESATVRIGEFLARLHTLYWILSPRLERVTCFSKASPTFSSLSVFAQLSKVPVTKTSFAGCGLESG